MAKVVSKERQLLLTWFFNKAPGPSPRSQSPVTRPLSAGIKVLNPGSALCPEEGDVSALTSEVKTMSEIAPTATLVRSWKRGAL